MKQKKDRTQPPSKVEASALRARILQTLQQYDLLQDDDRVVIGFSTGSDSTALLHIFKTLPFKLQLTAVYIDHGLRPQESKIEIEQATAICAQLGVTLKILKTDIPAYARSSQLSIEDCARQERYRLLHQARKELEARWIAVAHTADDQVEEFFIRLIRGTGAKGLSGMQLQNGQVIRPLLHETKAHLRDYLQYQDLNWCDDSSNDDTRFLRNQVRQDLLPMLEKQFNPSLRKNVLQAMNILQQEDKFLDTLCTEHYKRCVSVSVTKSQTENLQLNVEIFRNVPKPLGRRILEKCCWQMGVRPSFFHIEQMRRMLEEQVQSGEIHLSDGVRVYFDEKDLSFCRPLPKGQIRGSIKPEIPAPFHIEVSEPGRYTLPLAERTVLLEYTCPADVPHTTQNSETNILYVDAALLNFPLTLRPARPGERFQPCNRAGSKKIARYFNEKKIPAHRRLTWPVLSNDSGVIALVGLEIDHKFRKRTGSKTLLSIRFA